MTAKQFNLFGEEDNPPAELDRPEIKNYSNEEKPTSLINFLPGVKIEEAYPDIQSYQALEDLARGCELCRLRSTCSQVVFGVGPQDARIMFIGEGPGKDEDEQGIPFVGRAGQLLNKILVSADFDRSQVYITNVVKCRPPGNRLPNPDETRVCRNYLEAQIRIIRPKIIVCLGALACQIIIDPRVRITQTRGRWMMRNNIMIMATYHPAALLRNESYKRPTWEDFKLIRDEFKRLTS